MRIANEAITNLVNTINDPGWMVVAIDRLEILFGVAPYRSAIPDWDDLFKQAYSLSYAHWRAEALIKYARFAPQEERPELVAESLTEGAHWNGSSSERAKFWEGLIESWQQLPPMERQKAWNQGFRELAERPRDAVLLDLAFLGPIVNSLGGVAAVQLAIKAIQEASRIWP